MKADVFQSHIRVLPLFCLNFTSEGMFCLANKSFSWHLLLVVLNVILQCD